MVKKRRKIKGVADAKNVEELTKSIIDDVKSKYQYPYFPRGFRIAIPKRAKVPKEVREYARKRQVKIDRLRY
jgi:hypothetical protein